MCPRLRGSCGVDLVLAHWSGRGFSSRAWTPGSQHHVDWLPLWFRKERHNRISLSTKRKGDFIRCTRKVTAWHVSKAIIFLAFMLLQQILFGYFIPHHTKHIKMHPHAPFTIIYIYVKVGFSWLVSTLHFVDISWNMYNFNFIILFEYFGQYIISPKSQIIPRALEKLRDHQARCPWVYWITWLCGLSGWFCIIIVENLLLLALSLTILLMQPDKRS